MRPCILGLPQHSWLSLLIIKCETQESAVGGFILKKWDYSEFCELWKILWTNSIFMIIFWVDFQFQSQREDILPKWKMVKTLWHGFWYQLSYLGNARILRVFGTSALHQKTNCGLQCCQTCNFCPTNPLLVRVKAHLRLRLSIFGNFPNLGKVLIKGIHLFSRLL